MLVEHQVRAVRQCMYIKGEFLSGEDTQFQ